MENIINLKQSKEIEIGDVYLPIEYKNEMEKEYYTPEIEELYVGYECYDFGTQRNRIIEDPEYIRTVSFLSTKTNTKGKTTYNLKNIIKTKCLDHDDLMLFLHNKSVEDKDYYAIGFNIETKKLWIMGYKGKDLFEGYCKSINELKNVFKYLKLEYGK